MIIIVAVIIIMAKVKAKVKWLMHDGQPGPEVRKRARPWDSITRRRF
jgi:hypothetical protein